MIPAIIDFIYSIIESWYCVIRFFYALIKPFVDLLFCKLANLFSKIIQSKYFQFINQTDWFQDNYGKNSVYIVSYDVPEHKYLRTLFESKKAIWNMHGRPESMNTELFGLWIDAKIALLYHNLGKKFAQI